MTGGQPLYIYIVEPLDQYELHFEIEIKGEQSHRRAVGKGNLSFFRLNSIESRALSKLLITSGTCKTPKRGRGRHFNRIDMISGKVNCESQQTRVMLSPTELYDRAKV